LQIIQLADYPSLRGSLHPSHRAFVVPTPAPERIPPPRREALRVTRRGVGRPADAVSDETRTAILAAARNLFASVGYAATSNRSVAAAAGVTHGTVYHYFKTKLELFTAVVDGAYDQLLDILGSTMLPAGFGDRITGIGSLISEVHSRDAALLQFLARVPLERARNPEIRDAVGPSAWATYDLVRQFVASGVDSGDLSSDVDLEAMTAMLTACLLGITLYSELENDVTFAAIIREFGRLVEGGHISSARLAASSASRRP
jgi:AcrR family transcriptional regulator